MKQDRIDYRMLCGGLWGVWLSAQVRIGYIPDARHARFGLRYVISAE